MRIIRTEQFERNYTSLPRITQKKVDQKLKLILANLTHPGIRAKKIKGAKDIWEGRVDRFYRFTFQIEKDTIILRRVGTHEILRKI